MKINKLVVLILVFATQVALAGGNTKDEIVCSPEVKVWPQGMKIRILDLNYAVQISNGTRQDCTNIPFGRKFSVYKLPVMLGRLEGDLFNRKVATVFENHINGGQNRNQVTVGLPLKVVTLSNLALAKAALDPRVLETDSTTTLSVDGSPVAEILID